MTERTGSTRSIRGRRALVTGGAGFIGSHLVDSLIEAGAERVVVVDNFFLGKHSNLSEARAFDGLAVYHQDASDYPAMESIIRNEGVDVTFNLATKALGHSFADPLDAFKVNIDVAGVLLELLRRESFQTLIHCSSSEAYGSAQYVPIDEGHPLNPLTLYAAGKAATDLMLESYLHMFELDAAVVRPFNNFGPRQNEGTYAAVIPLTIQRIKSGEPPLIFGDGEQTRDFIYVKDTVRALLSAYEIEAARGQVINVATGNEVTVNTVVAAICRCMGYAGPIDHGPERSADVRRHLGSIERARTILGFEPRVSLDDGMCDTVEWYLANATSPDDKTDLRTWGRGPSS